MIVGRWRSVLWLTGALLALSLGGWVAPAPARAACGDYVTFGHAHPQPPTSPAQPCRGPLCSHGAVPPPAPVPPAPTTLAEEWAQLLTPAPPDNPEARGWCFDSGPDRPLSRGRTVFHPPRQTVTRFPL